MKKLLLVVSIVLLLITFVARAQSAPAVKYPPTLRIGHSGGAGESMSIALGQALERNRPTKSVVQKLAGPTQAIEMLKDKQLDFYNFNSQYGADAYYADRGLWIGKEPVDICMIFFSHYGTTSFGVRPGEGINKIQDLAGKKVMLTWAGNAEHSEKGQRILAYYGVLDKITDLKYASYDAQVEAMAQKRADAFYQSTGGYWANEIGRQVGLQWLEVSPACSIQVSKEMKIANMYPAYISSQNIEDAGLPPGTKIWGQGYSTCQYTRLDMPNELIYDVLEAFWGNIREFDALRWEVKAATIDKATTFFVLPFHPAAVKFYKDKGVWTRENEERQKELLAKPRLNPKK